MVCVCVFGISASVAAGEEWRDIFSRDRDAHAIFLDGVEKYRVGDYGLAERQFKSLLPAATIKDEEIVAVYIAKCLLAQQLYPEAESWLAECRDKYAGGLYEDIFLYLSGHTAYNAGNPQLAAAYYLRTYDLSRDARLRNQTVACLSPLFARWLNDTQIHELADDIPEGPVAVEYYFQRARRQESQGRTALAEQSYREALRRGHDDVQYQKIQEALESLLRREGGVVRVGLLYPATGPLSNFGASMFDAAQLAAKTWSDNSGGRIQIVAEDTGGDPLTASLAARRLVEEGVSAVVGPLTSEGAVAVANILSCVELTHVIPVASRPGLTALSAHLFQFMPTPLTVGEALADYAVDVRGDSAFAIIAPNDDYGREISRSFQKTAVQKGAVVYPIQYIEPGQIDHRSELMRLKRIFLRELYDTTIFVAEGGDTLNEEQVPVHIDGILLPVEANDLNTVLTQLQYYNISGHCLGTDGWADPELLSGPPIYLEGAVFASSEFHDPGNRRWSALRSAWQRTYGGTPDLIAARTYDAVIFAAKSAGEGDLSAKDPSTIPPFDGASGTIEFSPARENTHVPLYGYYHGRITPVEDMPQPDVGRETMDY